VGEIEAAVAGERRLPLLSSPCLIKVSRRGMAVRRQPTIAATGELGFLRRLLGKLPGGRGVVLGPGDDCAVVRMGTRDVLVTTDALVEHVHFERSWTTPRQIGRKAYLVNASDIASMGGRPRFCVVAAAVPPTFPAAELEQIHAGLWQAAAETGAFVVGGNLTRARELSLSVTLLGDAPPKPIRRAGARPGDVLFVTGTLGEAALGLRRLKRNSAARGSAVRRFLEPRPRLRAGAVLAEERIASAMIDVSDGLLGDLHHLCAASDVGAEVEAAALPRPQRLGRRGLELALGGGEDYELLCAVPARNLKRLGRLRSRLGCPLTRIGRIVPKGGGVRVLNERGREMAMRRLGFDHFAGGSR
jgi:thiamine-monophosphate kinase